LDLFHRFKTTEGELTTSIKFGYGKNNTVSVYVSRSGDHWGIFMDQHELELLEVFLVNAIERRMGFV